MMYEQSLFRVNKIAREHRRAADRLNDRKGFDYGYNEDFGFVVISKSGVIDLNNIYTIQGLQIALPPVPKKVYGMEKKVDDQVWEVLDYPKDLKKMKSGFEWNKKPMAFKEKHIDYILDTLEYREKGFWFMNGGETTYMTGSHYMFCNWSHIDIGLPHYRESNRLFWYFWEACKADHRSYGMCYLKNRRSGFSYMASAELCNLATQTKNSRYGILSKSNPDAKLLFTDKVVRIINNYPFWFKPIQSGSDKPKSEMVFDVPARKLTRRSMKEIDTEVSEGLNTSIDFKATGDYSYDGEKLKLLIQDESGKWEKPYNILKNHAVTRTCCRLGLDIVGKIMMGSTAGALAKGGAEFKKIYYGSDLRDVKRDGNEQTPYGLYSFFIPMEWNFEGTFDKFGKSVFEDPDKPILRYAGDKNNKRHFIKKGALSVWRNEYEGRAGDPDDQHAYLRQYPKTEKQAFRDEAQNSLFNLTRLYQQLEFNEDRDKDVQPIQGNFHWKDGVQDSTVLWEPNRGGRFSVSWLPHPNLTNIIELKNGLKKPGNPHLGAFGCDPYDISRAKAVGSAGALHGLTCHHFSVDVAPLNTFFLQYVTRPPEAEIFFEDVLMACVFYGMPILVEQNRSRLLYYLRRRGYRGYSLTRPDVVSSKLSFTDHEIGGIPMNGKEILRAHANGLEAWINRFVGKNEDGETGIFMPFERTLNDWISFQFDERTKYDATISSGLAIMANQRNLYRPVLERTTKTIDLGGFFGGYDNDGSHSKRKK